MLKLKILITLLLFLYSCKEDAQNSTSSSGSNLGNQTNFSSPNSGLNPAQNPPIANPTAVNPNPPAQNPPVSPNPPAQNPPVSPNPPGQNPPVSPTAINPPSTNPPVVNPPVVNPPVVNPPVVNPPVVNPPVVNPPVVNPPVVNPPVVNPPVVNPPVVNPPVVNPPVVNPPVVNPPVVNPPSATPTRGGGSTPTPTATPSPTPTQSLVFSRSCKSAFDKSQEAIDSCNGKNFESSWGTDPVYWSDVFNCPSGKDYVSFEAQNLGSEYQFGGVCIAEHKLFSIDNYIGLEVEISNRSLPEEQTFDHFHEEVGIAYAVVKNDENSNVTSVYYQISNVGAYKKTEPTVRIGMGFPYLVNKACPNSKIEYGADAKIKMRFTIDRVTRVASYTYTKSDGSIDSCLSGTVTIPANWQIFLIPKNYRFRYFSLAHVNESTVEQGGFPNEYLKDVKISPILKNGQPEN